MCHQSLSNLFILLSFLYYLLYTAISNYAAKKDNDAGVAIRGFGTTVIESYNFLTTLNNKYNVISAVSTSISKVVQSAEAESEGFEKVSKSVNKGLEKFKEVTSEFDLLRKSQQAAVAVSTITDSILEKVEELNTKVSLSTK